MSSRKPVIVAAVVSMLALGGLAAPASAAELAPTAASDHAPTTTINGYRSVGYYGGWQATGTDSTRMILRAPTTARVTTRIASLAVHSGSVRNAANP